MGSSTKIRNLLETVRKCLDEARKDRFDKTTMLGIMRFKERQWIRENYG